MWDSELKKKHKAAVKPPFFFRRGFLIGTGAASIVLAFVVLGISLFEGFFGGGKVRMLQLPGFHEMELDSAGLYAGIYQHRGTNPMPVKELTQMDVRVMAKDDYEEVPVLMNSAGQTFHRFGMRGLPLFNFAISRPGSYTLSGVYTGGSSGPDVNVLVVPQSAGNIKQTLSVGIGFFIFFLAIGVFLLLRLEHWAPKKKLTAA